MRLRELAASRVRFGYRRLTVLFSLEDAREKLEAWRRDYNLRRPHSALRDEAPGVFAEAWSKSVSADSELAPSPQSP